MKATLGIISGLIITIFLISSCASTGKERVPTTWMDASYSGKPLESVLVVGFTDNLKNRKLFEDTFLQSFRDNRIRAHSSIEALGEGGKIDADSIKQAAEELGLETVLVTLKTNLYEVSSEKLFWSYTSQTSLIATVESFMATVCTDVIKKLKKDHLIQ
jgi:hypothetical protein